ncbi:MAG: hypothetical protein RL336_1743 [Pseudomonadota bacterium]|jgi:anti-anti-sigma regulatory factor
MGAKKSHVPFVLPAALTIAEVEGLHDALQAMISSDHPCLDASEVERIDTAAIQQILAFSKALQNTNTSLAWHACSDVFIASVEQIGLKDALGLEREVA